MGNLNQCKLKQRNYTFDLFKFVASFFIVCIHFKIDGRLGEIITVFARFAVPFFFMISGYYSAYDDKEKTKAKIINIIKLYFFAVVLYFCFNVMVKWLNGQYKEAIWYVSTYLRIEYTSKVLLFNESITAMHIWFLGSLIYSYVIRYFIIKAKIGDNIIYGLSCILILINISLGIGLSVLGVETPELLQRNYILRNFLFMGFPFFSFGKFIKQREIAILNKISGKVCVLFLILGVIETMIVCRIDWMKDLYIGSILFAFTLFVIAIRMREKTYSSKMIALCNTSTNVYVIHVMIGEIFNMTMLKNMQFYLYLSPVIVFIVSVAISLLVKRITDILSAR